jgi:hypothetical protein
MDGQDGVADVVGLEIKGPKLGVGQLLSEPGQGCGDVGRYVLPLAGELQKDLEILLLPPDSFVVLDVAAEPLLALLEGLGPFLIPPDLRGRELGVQRIEFGSLAIEVKENLGVPRTWRKRLRWRASGQNIFRCRASRSIPCNLLKRLIIKKMRFKVKQAKAGMSP